jgi:2-polyprenyl-3-methyl-5-hydroxy-6-metoxy-1,4-benzoquinol methylase
MAQTYRHSFTNCKICGGALNVKNRVTVDGLPLATCANCGLLMVKDIPEWHPEAETASVETYYSEIATDKSKFSHALNLIDSCLSPSRRPLGDHKILDVGCGDGYFMSYCRDRGITAYGYDILPSAVALAQRRGLTVYSDLNQVKEKFDVITLFDVLEHMENPVQELLALAQLLRDGGLIFIETPRKCVVDFYLSILEFFNIAHNNRVSREHLQLFSNESLRILTDKVGLKICNFESKTSLSWSGEKGFSTYISNVGIKWQPANQFLSYLVQLLLKANIFGKNKAILVATKISNP